MTTTTITTTITNAVAANSEATPNPPQQSTQQPPPPTPQDQDTGVVYKELPRGTTYLGCNSGTLPGGKQRWKKLGDVRTVTQCAEQAIEQGHAAVALRGYDQTLGTSECHVRTQPWTDSETKAADAADRYSCHPFGGVAMGGGSDAYAIYNVRPTASAAVAAGPPPPNASTCDLKRLSRGLRANETGGSDICVASVVTISNPCFTEPMVDNQPFQWVMERARLVGRGVVSLSAGGSLLQNIPPNAGWLPGQTYRVTVTIRRSKLDFSMHQSMRARVALHDGRSSHSDVQVVDLGTLDLHNLNPETKDFPETFLYPHPAPLQAGKNTESAAGATFVTLLLEHLCDPPAESAEVLLSSVAVRLAGN